MTGQGRAQDFRCSQIKKTHLKSHAVLQLWHQQLVSIYQTSLKIGKTEVDKTQIYPCIMESRKVPKIREMSVVLCTKHGTFRFF